MVTAISVVRDFSLYRRCLRENPKCGNMEFVALDNTVTNEPIPIRYNRFLDDCNDLGDSWLLFCHEDFEPWESIEKKIDELSLDEHALYGPIGCRRKGFAGFGMQVYCGEIEECKREGVGEPWKVGRPIVAPVEVETFDCCCLLVHSALIRQHDLRFDEELQFDLYVEDFCAAARLHHGIKSYAIPFKACHHSFYGDLHLFWNTVVAKTASGFYVGNCSVKSFALSGRLPIWYFPTSRLSKPNIFAYAGPVAWRQAEFLTRPMRLRRNFCMNPIKMPSSLLAMDMLKRLKRGRNSR